MIVDLSPEVARHDETDRILLTKLAELARPLIAEQVDRVRVTDSRVRIFLDTFTQANANRLAQEAVAVSISLKRSFQILIKLDEEGRGRLRNKAPQLAVSDEHLVNVGLTEAATVSGFLRLFADAS